MKRSIQIASLLGLVVMLGSVAANAQSSYGNEVNIPFAFSVGDRSYSAGKYVVKLNKFESGSGVVTIGNRRTDKVQTFLVRTSGESSAHNFNLVFEQAKGTRVLSRLLTPGGAYSLAGEARPRAVAGRKIDPARTAIVDLGGIY